MDLLFPDAGLQAIAESIARSDARFGISDAAILRQRLCELVAADNLAIAAKLLTLGVVPMEGHDRAFAILLRRGLRLVVEIDGSMACVGRNGAIDLQKVETVRVVKVEECDEP